MQKRKNVKFTNNLDGITHKEVIQNFILVQINEGLWKAGSKIPSEGTLALKFNCNRLTVRNVLQNFVYNGILHSIKGKGYFVTYHGINNLSISTEQEFKVNNKKIEQIDHESFVWEKEWFNFLNIQKDQLDTNDFYYSTKYFQDDDLMIYDLSILNKNEIVIFDNIHKFKSLISFLINQGLKLTNITSMLVFSSNENLKEIAKNLGWTDSEFPIIISLIESENNWVEISLKIIRKSIFKFTKSNKLIL